MTWRGGAFIPPLLPPLPSHTTLQGTHRSSADPPREQAAENLAFVAADLIRNGALAAVRHETMSERWVAAFACGMAGADMVSRYARVWLADDEFAVLGARHDRLVVPQHAPAAGVHPDGVVRAGRRALVVRAAAAALAADILARESVADDGATTNATLRPIHHRAAQVTCTLLVKAMSAKE